MLNAPPAIAAAAFGSPDNAPTAVPNIVLAIIIVLLLLNFS